MNYSEAKKVLAQQDAAKAVLAKYEKLANAHEAHGFQSRREFIKALQEMDIGAKAKPRGKRGLSPETIDQIHKLKSEGKTNADIARTTGVSPLTVGKYVKAQAGGKAAPARARGKAKKK
jgi:hypothetical protein